MPLTRFAPLPAALAAALVAMAARLSVASDPFGDLAYELDAAATEADRLRAELLALVHDDEAAFDRVMAARREGDGHAVQLAYGAAVEPPLRACEQSLRVLELAADVAEHVHPHEATDVAVAIVFAAASLEAAALTVEFELGPVDDKDYGNACIRAVETARERAKTLRSEGLK